MTDLNLTKEACLSGQVSARLARGPACLCGNKQEMREPCSRKTKVWPSLNSLSPLNVRTSGQSSGCPAFFLNINPAERTESTAPLPCPISVPGLGYSLHFPANQQRARLQGHTPLTPPNNPSMYLPSHQPTHPSACPFIYSPTHTLCAKDNHCHRRTRNSLPVLLSIWDSCYRLDTLPLLPYHLFIPWATSGLCVTCMVSAYIPEDFCIPKYSFCPSWVLSSPQESTSLEDHNHSFVPQGSLSHVGVLWTLHLTHRGMSVVLCP